MLENQVLLPGLYLVATPIGNLGDITYRAVNTLQACDVIYCEDTRKTRVLLQHYGICTHLQTYHEHNATTVRPKIVAAVANGQKVALVSDAGMPLISDPGYKLVQEFIAAGLPYTVLPGSSASLSGLVLSGMPTDKFFFAGFYDPKKAKQYGDIPSSIIFYESARRLRRALESLQCEYPDRNVAVVREITKVYEEVTRGSYSELIDWTESKEVKGELVIILSPPSVQEVTDDAIRHCLSRLLQEMSVKEAAIEAAAKLNIPRRKAYQVALGISSIE